MLNLTAAEPKPEQAKQPADDQQENDDEISIITPYHKYKTGNANAPTRKVTTHDVMQAQLEAIGLKKENLLLKRRKLELQIQLLERQVASDNVHDHIGF